MIAMDSLFDNGAKKLSSTFGFCSFIFLIDFVEQHWRRHEAYSDVFMHVQPRPHYSLSKKSAKFGIDITGSKINFPEIQKRKANIIEQLGRGMQFLLKDISFLNGEAQFISTEELTVGDDRIKAKNVIIATGSKPIQIPGLSFDGRKVISSSDILNLKSLPRSLLIIGGGVIGCEFASLFSIVEYVLSLD